MSGTPRVCAIVRVATLLAAALLAACRDAGQPPVVATSPLADSADQVMFGVNTILTSGGLLRARMAADTAYFFDDNSRIELRGVRTTFYGQTGAQTSVLTSRRGTYNGRTSTMEARRNVVVVSTDGKRLTTEQLRYNQTQDQISSDSAFVLTEPGRELTGIGFVSDPNMNNVRILRQPQGSGGTFTLPGQ